MVLSGPGGAVIIVRDNDHLIKARRRSGDPFRATRSKQDLCHRPKRGLDIRTEFVCCRLIFPTGMPIYPSTWSDTGNQFYYIFCTYFISMIHYCTMIAYAIYTIITLICIRYHICSVILQFSYFSIIQVYHFIYVYSISHFVHVLAIHIPSLLSCIHIIFYHILAYSICI